MSVCRTCLIFKDPQGHEVGIFDPQLHKRKSLYLKHPQLRRSKYKVLYCCFQIKGESFLFI